MKKQIVSCCSLGYENIIQAVQAERMQFVLGLAYISIHVGDEISIEEEKEIKKYVNKVDVEINMKVSFFERDGKIFRYCVATMK
jgi:hypothetical protein